MKQKEIAKRIESYSNFSVELHGIRNVRNSENDIGDGYDGCPEYEKANEKAHIRAISNYLSNRLPIGIEQHLPLFKKIKSLESKTKYFEKELKRLENQLLSP